MKMAEKKLHIKEQVMPDDWLLRSADHLEYMGESLLGIQFGQLELSVVAPTDYDLRLSFLIVPTLLDADILSNLNQDLYSVNLP